VAGVHAAEAVRRYVVRLLAHTRGDRRVVAGASPRAGLMLIKGAQAHAALAGRDHVLPDDVQALASPVLTHRLLLHPQGAAGGAVAVLDDALAAVPAA